MFQVRKEKRHNQVVPFATLGLIALNFLLYFAATGFYPLLSPSKEIFYQWGLSTANPLALVSYGFLHLWFSHLIFDSFLLLIFGSILEQYIGARKTVIVYLVSAIVPGIAHLLLTPTQVLVGSSAAVFGIIGAAIVVSPVVSIVTFLLLGQFVMTPLVDKADAFELNFQRITKTEYQGLLSLKGELEATANSILYKLQGYKTEAEQLQDQFLELEAELDNYRNLYTQGKITFEEYDNHRIRIESLEQPLLARLKEIQGTIKQQQALFNSTTERRTAVETEENKTLGILEKIDYTTQLKARTPEAKTLHVIGLFTGYLTLIYIHRASLMRWRHWLRKLIYTRGS